LNSTKQLIILLLKSQVDKFVTVKGLTYDLISGCQEVIKIRDVVVRLMKRCEGMSKTMEKTVHDLIHSNTQMDDSEQITKQPKLLNPEYVINDCRRFCCIFCCNKVFFVVINIAEVLLLFYLKRYESSFRTKDLYCFILIFKC
jgi:hypothetical protein